MITQSSHLFYNRQTYAPDYANDNILRMVFAASCPYGEGDPSLLEKSESEINGKFRMIEGYFRHMMNLGIWRLFQ